jgi:SAM-dependent methyltransferase
VSLYSKYVLPRFIDLAMRNPEARQLRAARIPQARGEVLEVGIGSGLNLEFYTSAVRRVYGVDPSLELQAMARQRTGGPEVVFFAQSAEKELPLPRASIDTVLTWTLCSIPNPESALAEMRRVLKPAGTLIFVEHGRSPDSNVVAWQDRLTPIWKHIAGGCHLNRRIDEIIKTAGFQVSEMTNDIHLSRLGDNTLVKRSRDRQGADRRGPNRGNLATDGFRIKNRAATIGSGQL